jgi:hypothetical protein
VHGANLGIRASAYLESGGFYPVAQDEDVDIVARSVAQGATVSSSGAHSVLTSARLFGRTEGGCAGYLRDQLVPLAAYGGVDAARRPSRQGLPI